jgi:hypothetical protein
MRCKLFFFFWVFFGMFGNIFAQKETTMDTKLEGTWQALEFVNAQGKAIKYPSHFALTIAGTTMRYKPDCNTCSRKFQVNLKKKQISFDPKAGEACTEKACGGNTPSGYTPPFSKISYERKGDTLTFNTAEGKAIFKKLETK